MTELGLNRRRRLDTHGGASRSGGTAFRSHCGGSFRSAGAMAAAAAVSVPATATVATDRPEPGPMEFGRLTIDTDAREVVVDARVVELTKLEFDLLAHMAAAPRRVYSRGQLLSDVWHSSPEWQTLKTVTEHVRRLRQKIEPRPAEPRWIQTVLGAGYRFEP